MMLRMATILGPMAPHLKSCGFFLSRQEHTRRNWIGVPLARDIPLTLRKHSGWSPRALASAQWEKLFLSAGVHHDFPSYKMAFGEKTDIIYIYIYFLRTHKLERMKRVYPRSMIQFRYVDVLSCFFNVCFLFDAGWWRYSFSLLISTKGYHWGKNKIYKPTTGGLFSINNECITEYNQLKK